MSNLVERKYVDESGINRLVLVPANSNGIDLSEGIPISLDLDPLYEHLPLEFRVRLYNALWDRGLIKPHDFLAPDAPEKYMAAIRSIIKRDALDAVKLANEVIRNGNRH